MKNGTQPITLIITAIALVVLMLGPARAEQSLVIATVNYPPYSFAVEDEIGGICPAIVHEAAERAGIDIEIVVVPARRVLKLTETGKFDAAFNLTWTPERAEKFDFGEEPLINEEIVLVTRTDTDFEFDGNLQSLSGTRIGAVSGFSLGKQLDDAFSTGVLIKEESSSTEANMRMLMKGRIDIAASDKLSALATMAARDNFKSLRLLSRAIESAPTFLAFTKARDLSDVRARFDAALQEMRELGVTSAIVKRQLNSHR